MISRSASVRARKQAPDVNHGRKCRQSIAIRYSSACSFVTTFVRLRTAHLIEQRSAPAISAAATAAATSSPTMVSESSRNVNLVTTAGSAAAMSAAGFGSVISRRWTFQPSASSSSAKAAISGALISRAISTRWR